VEIIRDSRKVYCWTLTVDKAGHPIPSPFQQESEPWEYEGWHFSYMNPDQVKFH